MYKPINSLVCHMLCNGSMSEVLYELAEVKIDIICFIWHMAGLGAGRDVWKRSREVV